MSKRLPELDSARGIAALIVLNCHFFGLVPVIYKLLAGSAVHPGIGWVLLSPLFILFAGHTAVLLFFVLSGFVLMIPFLEAPTDEENIPAYLRYVLRRVCRIYVPYFFWTAIAMMGATFLPATNLGGVGDIVADTWTRRPDLTDLLQHLLLIGPLTPRTYNLVIWSLVHEVRVSLVFPFIAAAIVAMSWKKSAYMAGVICVTGVATSFAFRAHPQFASWATSIQYASMFVIGATMAKYRVGIVNWLFRRSSSQYAMLVLGVTLLCSMQALVLIFQSRTFTNLLIEQLCLAGVCGAILLAMTTNWMRRAPLVWLGRVSYSLYLCHIPVMLTLLRVGYGHVPLPVLIAMMYAASFLAAELSFRAVERPAMKLSRRIGHGRSGRLSQPTQQLLIETLPGSQTAPLESAPN